MATTSFGKTFTIKNWDEEDEVDIFDITMPTLSHDDTLVRSILEGDDDDDCQNTGGSGTSLKCDSGVDLPGGLVIATPTPEDPQTCQVSSDTSFLTAQEDYSVNLIDFSSLDLDDTLQADENENWTEKSVGHTETEVECTAKRSRLPVPQSHSQRNNNRLETDQQVVSSRGRLLPELIPISSTHGSMWHTKNDLK